MAQPKADKIFEKIRSLFQGMTVAGGFNYAPTVVHRWERPEPNEHFHGDEEVVYVIFPGDSRTETGRTTGDQDAIIQKEMEIEIIAARRSDLARKATQPHSEALQANQPSRERVKENLSQDIERALFTDVRLGGLSWQIVIVDVNLHLVVEQYDAIHVPITVSHDTRRSDL